VTVALVSTTSVHVSWDSINVTGIAGYTVSHYQAEDRRASVTVPSSVSSVVIKDLLYNAKYWFQVGAIFPMNGDMFAGTRSHLYTVTTPRPGMMYNRY
jgi:chitodextrinase